MKTSVIAILLIVILNICSYGQQGTYALKFDGANNYVDLPDGIANYDNFTFEAWVYWNGAQTSYWQRIFDFGYSSTTGYMFLTPAGDLSANSGKPLFGITLTNNTAEQKIYATTKLLLNQWYHFAVTIDNATTTGKLYINGVLEGTNTGMTLHPSDLGSTTNNWIGKSQFPSDSYFNGLIDEVRIWNTARTEAEIKANMYKEISTHANLKAYYQMSDGTLTSLTDNSGNSNTATLTNGPEWKASGCFAGPRNALDFDGTDEYVSITDGVVLGNTFTQEMWIYPTDATETYRGILGKQPSTGSDHRPPCIFQFGQKIHYGFGNGTWYSELTSNILTINSWNHLAVTFDNTTYRVYVNGILVNSSLVASGKTPEGWGQDELGKVDIGYFQGKIDEVRIWSTARTEAQIRENMMKTFAGNESGLAAYYRMDYGDGTTLYDNTSNAWNGTLTNMETADWVSSSAFNTWIGSESVTWSTAGNWSRNTAPVSTDNIGIYKWTTLGNECTISGTPITNSLLFSSTASPTLSSALTVNGNLILKKNLDLNGQTVTLGSTGSLSEGSYRLYGSTGTITTTRTLSNISAENVGGLGATITTTANMGSTVITRGHTQQGSGSNKSIFRYYNIAPTTNTGLDATLVFNYKTEELNEITEAKLILFKSTNSGTDWTLEGGTVYPDNDNVELTGIGSFSRWTAGDMDNPLPVSLSSFTSNISGRNIKLSWITASEQNNSGFNIERKSITGDFAKIGFVNGKGTVNTPSSYSFEDRNMQTGKYSYRLKQIDNNGNFEFHNLNGTIEVGIPNKFDLSQNYPNPFNPTTKINFDLPADSKVTLVIYDVTGRQVTKLLNNELRTAGYYTIEFNGSSMASGIYFYRFIALTAGKQTVMSKRMALIK